MPFDSYGNFTRVHNWEQDRIDDIDIVTDHHDEEDDNFTEALNQCFLRNGTVPMQGELNLGGFKAVRVGNGTDKADAVNKSQLDESAQSVSDAMTALINKLWKIGDIKQSVKDANHDNWFLCDGQAVSRTDYSDLFALIGTKFGQGDGTTTFNLPDYRGKFLRGLGGDSAADIQTTQAEGLPNITGSMSPTIAGSRDKKTAQRTGAFTGSDISNPQKVSDYPHGNPDSYSYLYFNNNSLVFDASKANGIYGASNHVTPINQAVNFFIKVKEEE